MSKLLNTRICRHIWLYFPVWLESLTIKKIYLHFLYVHTNRLSHLQESLAGSRASDKRNNKPASHTCFSRKQEGKRGREKEE